MRNKSDRPIMGWRARWYASQSENDAEEFKRLAGAIAREVAPGANILEVGFGPGFLSVELAKLGMAVTGLDLSSDFVRIASENAQEAGVKASFLFGNASAMPFQSDAFDFVVSRAAFKNFGRPLDALNEMHRVLRPGGRALIIDLRKDASLAEIDRFLEGSGRGWLSVLLSKLIFRRVLIPSAYLEPELAELAGKSRFGKGRIEPESFGFELRLEKKK